MHGGNEHPVALPNTPVSEITELLTSSRLGAVNIVKDRKSRRLAGILTDGDIRRALGRQEEFFELRARDLMTAKPVTIEADMLASQALDLMENRPTQISVLPVVDNRVRALGIVRVHDLLQVGKG